MSDPLPSTNPIADLPTGDPIPSSSSSTSPSKPPPPLPLGALLLATPANLDALLTRLNKCLSTPTGIDTVLLFLCYTSRFSAAVLSSLSRSALRRSARDWIALVSSLPPRTTILFAAAASDGSAAATGGLTLAPAALALAQRLKALSTLLSEARMILRLWGLLGMYFWGKGLVAKLVRARQAKAKGSSEKTEEVGDSQSTLETVIAWTQLVTCVIFQALENGAYLSSKGVMGWSAATQGKAYKWSARFWAMYVGVELGRLAFEAKGKAKGKGRAVAEERDWTEAWRRQVARNLAWAPLTVHWSMDKGFVNEMMVGLLGSIPGIIQMRQLWKESA